MRASLLSVLVIGACGCGGSSSPPPASAETPPPASPVYNDPCGPGDDVEQGALTAGAGAEAGARTAAEGVKAAGKTVGGWFEGGSDEAKEEWSEGKEKTRTTARKESSHVKSVSTTRPCTPKGTSSAAPPAAPAPAPAPSP